jgi:hypothetical protein
MAPPAEGQLYDRRDIPQIVTLVPLPELGEPGGSPSAAVPFEQKGPGHATSVQPGPMSFSKVSDLSVGGSAIVFPRGGTISSPKERADRQIQQLIRRLN